MPNIKSAKKRLRQNVVRRDRNRAAKSRMRNACKKLLKSVQSGNVEEAEATYREVTKLLDKAGSSKLIHKNAADRKKSRLSAAIKKMKMGKAA